MSFTSKQTAFIDAAVSYNETQISVDFDSVSKIELTNIADFAGLKFPHWLTRVPTYKVGRGLWKIPVNGSATPKAVADSPVKVEKAPEPVTITSKPTAPVSVVEMTKGSTSTVTNIPNKDPLFVPFGNFTDVVSIFKSKMFYPIYVTGLSGNGKTFMIEQAAAKAGRELFRVNITVETDEDDLLGGFRLVDGETVWFDGPIVEAMRKGALVLLDEVDLASTKVMCLQPVLEGKGVFLKKINEFVECQPGFNIVATANTKGKGDETGNFIGAGVMNEAFLERFPITVEQEYPSNAVEKKILEKVFDKLNISDSEFVEKLIKWADIIRKTYVEGAIDELITTRRLVHISNAYAIFNMDRMKAISMCVNRFDDETKTAMVDLYTKVDSGVESIESSAVEEVTEAGSNDCPF
jgi:MoxR-like ATPase